MKPLDLSGRVALRPQEAARACGVSLNTLLSWRSLGLPHVTIGRCLLVPVAELRSWLSEQAAARSPRPTDEPREKSAAGLLTDNQDTDKI
jgi:hypothetical protein